MESHRKSPITGPPLRSPGQSITEHQWAFAERKALWPLGFAAIMLVLAVGEWMRFFNPRPPQPWIFTVVAACAVGFAAYRSVTVRRTLRQLRQARDGERVVGEFLEKLRSDGYQVYHDLVGDGFNLDHVLIGPAGVFTIETKTYSKPDKGKAELTFDGERIKFGLWEPERKPVIQARAQVGWLSSLLKETTGRDFPVHPVIVFPGWFVRSEGRPKQPIWVLNPKALPAFLSKQEPKLTKEDIQLASFHLSRFIRVEEGRRRVK
jgi:hypothetical protein